MRGTAHTAFGTSHPVVPALYIAITLAMTMSAFHPVLIALSIAGALAYAGCVDGSRAAVAPLWWQMPLLCLIALVNPLFARGGSTVLFVLFDSPVYLESLWYGMCMAGLLVAGVLWLRAAGHLISYDKVTFLLGGAAPVLALMVSMSMRLIPQFVRRGRHIAAVQRVAVSCGGRSEGGRAAARGEAVSRRLRQSSVLMGWAMEDSLVVADVMRARGWGAAPRRTSYARYRLTRLDVAVAAALLVLGGACVAIAWEAAGAFEFYPVVSPIRPWWGYAPFAAWMAIPAVLHLYERSVWS